MRVDVQAIQVKEHAIFVIEFPLGSHTVKLLSVIRVCKCRKEKVNPENYRIHVDYYKDNH